MLDSPRFHVLRASQDVSSILTLPTNLEVIMRIRVRVTKKSTWDNPTLGKQVLSDNELKPGDTFSFIGGYYKVLYVRHMMRILDDAEIESIIKSSMYMPAFDKSNDFHINVNHIVCAVVNKNGRTSIFFTAMF
jgi:hypothetical protein